MYGTVANFRTYATAAGYDVTGMSDAEVTASLTSASVFVDGLGFKQSNSGRAIILWPGQPTVAGQSNEWPRTGAADVYGNTFTDTEIPTKIEHATYEASLYSLSGGDINRVSSADQTLIREKYDVIEFQYSDPNANGNTASKDTRPMIPSVMSLLSGILGGGDANSAGSFGITLIATP